MSRIEEGIHRDTSQRVEVKNLIGIALLVRDALVKFSEKEQMFG